MEISCLLLDSCGKPAEHVAGFSFENGNGALKQDSPWHLGWLCAQTPTQSRSSGTSRCSWAGGCGQQVAKATQNSLINVSWVCGVGVAALPYPVLLLHMLPERPQFIYCILVSPVGFECHSAALKSVSTDTDRIVLSRNKKQGQLIQDSRMKYFLVWGFSF